jgi:predicted Zn-dependent peptidase
MLSLGKSLLVFDKIDSIEEVCEKIDNVTSGEIIEIANDIFDTSELSTLIYK